MKPQKILVMGLPGAGKTYLAERLAPKLDALHLNADKVRSEHNDWDFSDEGRRRQAARMKALAQEGLTAGKHVVVDFVCPTPETRAAFAPDTLVWVDTITSGRFEDTNKIFVPPGKNEIDFHITDHASANFWLTHIAKRINNTRWDSQAPTVQLLGRWQPWHEGHQALFDRAICKTGQVCIMVRDCHGVDDNPFDGSAVEKHIEKNLAPQYMNGVDYMIQHVPNITHITYGRDVGYAIQQEHFEKEVEDVSATKKRAELRSKNLLE